MDARPLKRIDLLRHELKALRFILDRWSSVRREPVEVPPREDFQSEQARQMYDAILGAADSNQAEQRLRVLELEDVDIESFLRLSGEHYYLYPALVRQRAEAIRNGKLRVESA